MGCGGGLRGGRGIDSALTLIITRPQEAKARARSPLVAALVHDDVGLPTRQLYRGFLAGFNVNKLQ